MSGNPDAAFDERVAKLRDGGATIDQIARALHCGEKRVQKAKHRLSLAGRWAEVRRRDSCRFDETVAAQMAALRGQGWSFTAIGKRHGISRRTVSLIVRWYKTPAEERPATYTMMHYVPVDERPDDERARKRVHKGTRTWHTPELDAQIRADERRLRAEDRRRRLRLQSEPQGLVARVREVA